MPNHRLVKSAHSVRFFALAATALALLLPAAMRAQNAPTATPSPAATARDEAATTDRVVVTANKREENVRDVPASITAFDDVELENLHAEDLADYAAYIPSLQVNSAGTPGKTSIALRGIAALSSGSTVGTYIDETPVGSSGLYQSANFFQLDLLPYDIRRVEVLRGPQGTLYGANSIGGLIKYVTLDPSLATREFHIGGGLSGTENAGDPGWDVHGVANVPLIQDHLALRVSYARNQIAGFIDNVANGSEGINDATQQTGHIALLWKPIEALTVRLSAFGQRIESDNSAVVRLDPVTVRPVFGDLKNRVDVDEPFEKEIGLISLTIDWDLGWATITTASAYSHITTDQRSDVTSSFGQYPALVGAGPAGLSGFDQGLRLDKFSQEVRLTSRPDGRFLWQLGAFYTYEDSNQSQFAFLRQVDGTPYPGPFAVLADLSIPATYEEEAVFANATYKFTNYLSLGAGLRYSHNDQTFAQVNTAGALIAPGTTPGSSAEDVVNFMVTPELKLWKDGLLYVRIASGYQPGGPNVALAGVPPQVDSSSLVSYEAGLKSEFADHRLIFDITGYHLEWSDIQVGAVVNNIGVLVNGGEATSNGVELSIAVRPITGLRLGLNGSYTDATFDAAVSALGALAGDRLPNIPEFQGSVTADYYFPLWGARSAPVVASGKDWKTMVPGSTQIAGWNGHLGGGVRMVGDRRSASSRGQTFPLDSYAALDLSADISNANWTVRLFVKNVTDERAYQNIDPFPSLTGSIDHLQGVPIQPRTVGVEVDFKF